MNHPSSIIHKREKSLQPSSHAERVMQKILCNLVSFAISIFAIIDYDILAYSKPSPPLIIPCQKSSSP